ncbi:MAG TPA: DUF1272 domain-containing protein [Chloroflexota bacterium]
MRESCERCGGRLTTTGEAFICSFECTFCPSCAGDMHFVCPKCSGERVRRPRRAPSPR